MSEAKLKPGPMCVATMGHPGHNRKLKAKDFHKGSFRFVPIPGPKNTKATVMIGCLIGKGQVWKPEAKKTITDRQGRTRTITGVCSKKGHPAEGATHGYMKIQKPKAGKCRPGYAKKKWKSPSKQNKKG